MKNWEKKPRYEQTLWLFNLIYTKYVPTKPKGKLPKKITVSRGKTNVGVPLEDSLESVNLVNVSGRGIGSTIAVTTKSRGHGRNEFRFVFGEITQRRNTHRRVFERCRLYLCWWHGQQCYQLCGLGHHSLKAYGTNALSLSTYYAKFSFYITPNIPSSGT